MHKNQVTCTYNFRWFSRYDAVILEWTSTLIAYDLLASLNRCKGNRAISKLRHLGKPSIFASVEASVRSHSHQHVYFREERHEGFKMENVSTLQGVYPKCGKRPCTHDLGKHTPKVPPLKYYGFLGGGPPFGKAHHCESGRCGMWRNDESQGKYPHSLWICTVPKLWRDYDLLQFLMGRNCAMQTWRWCFPGREVNIWHSWLSWWFEKGLDAMILLVSVGCW